MRTITTTLTIAAMLATGIAAVADTVVLNTGVRVHGEVTKKPDGTIVIDTGRSTVAYPASAVKSHEENDRMGKKTWEERRRNFEAREAKKTEQTGLTTVQRQTIRNALLDLRGADPALRSAALEKLKTLQREMDVFGYLNKRFAPNMVAFSLEVLHMLDPKRAVPVAREHIDSPKYFTRAKAIELLGRARDTSSIPGIARGLADHSYEVRVQAAFALGAIQAASATPALIASLEDVDPRVQAAAEQALEAIWPSAVKEGATMTVQDWQQAWEQQRSGVSGAIQLAALEPLADPEDEWIEDY